MVMMHKTFDPKTMTLTYRFEDDEGEEQELELPARYEVCPTCEGRGTHVNPSIDSHGITPEEFAEDPDFHEDYYRGVYDTTCYDCCGRRVVPEVDVANLSETARATLERVQEREEEEAYYRAQARSERAMERAMGC